MGLNGIRTQWFEYVIHGDAKSNRHLDIRMFIDKPDLNIIELK